MLRDCKTRFVHVVPAPKSNTFPGKSLLPQRSAASIVRGFLTASILALLAILAIPMRSQQTQRNDSAQPVVAAKPRSLITMPVDTSRVHILANHHPLWANPVNDTGALPPNQSMEILTFVLARPPELQQAFDQFLADQQNPASPDFHHWLTPAEVGERFGPSDQDVAAISGWLQSQGLHVNWITPSKVFVAFGGTAADVDRAFHTALHSYKVNGKGRISVSSDPLIPEAVAQSIKTVLGLFTIDEQPLHRGIVMKSDAPLLTSANGSHFLTPADFNLIYDIPTSYMASGQTIGIVGRSRVYANDVTNFNNLTHALVDAPTEIVPTAFGGIDPGPACSTSTGCTKLDDQGEATLDVVRAGGVAYGATLLLVVATNESGGIEADAQYLVQTTPVPAPVMSISFGQCEAYAGPSGVNFWDTLFQQAAAEGISSFVSSGDSGAAGCEIAFSAPSSQSLANSPNYICSSSYATCVGGTQFNDTTSPSTYWNTGNGFGYSSARSYIPEGGWNESASNVVAGTGGGVSSFIPTPNWQKGVTGVPTFYAGRYEPDISFSSSLHDGYFGCFAAGGADCTNSFAVWGGTSAAAPSMAGVATLLNKTSGAPQGNLNPTIYSMFASGSSVFHDVTPGTAGVTSCSATTLSLCNNSTPTSSGGVQSGYLVGTGFDEVTGLGSIDVLQFLNNFPPASVVSVSIYPSSVYSGDPASVVITLSGRAPIGGTVVNLNSNNATVFPVPSTFTIPAGQIYASFSVTAGSVTQSTNATVTAAYNGSTQQTTVVVNPRPTISSIGIDPARVYGGASTTVTVTLSGPAPSSGGSLTFSSSDPAAFPIMPTATIFQGQTSYSFSVTTGSVATSTNVTVTATFENSSQQNTVTVTPAPAPTISSLSIAPSPVYGGALATVTITLSGPAPYGGAEVGVSSSNPSAFKWDGTYTVPAGKTSTSFLVTAQMVSSPASATVTATYNNSSQQATVTVNPMAINSVVISPTSVGSGKSATVTINLSAAAPITSTGVAISSSNSTVFPVPSTYYIPWGQTSASFAVTTGTVATATNITVTATYALQFANSSSQRQANVVVIPPTGNATATLTASPNLTNISSAQSITVGIVLAGSPPPTGMVSLLNGSTVLGTATLTSGTTSITASGLPVGDDTLTVSYSGDAVYSAISSNVGIKVVSSATPGFTLNATKVTVTCGATTNNTSTILLGSVASFAGNVTLTASISGSPGGATYVPTFSFGSTSPVTLAANGNTTATMTVSTTAASAALEIPPRPGSRWYTAGGAFLACLLCILVPRGRNWLNLLGLLILVVALISGVASCGGGGAGSGGSGSGSGGGISGTTAGTYAITVTGTSGSTTNANTITLIVQ